MYVDIEIIASRDTVHRCEGIWWFQPTPGICVEIPAGKMEKCDNGEIIIQATVEYSPGYPPPRTMDHDSPGFSDPGEGPSAELRIGKSYIPLSNRLEEEIIDQINERPSVYMDVYEGTPHPHDVKSEIARFGATALSFYVTTLPSAPWILPFACRRFRYLADVGRANLSP